MGRLKKPEDAVLKAKLAAPPVPARDWKSTVEKITQDPLKRETLLLELAKLDEIENALRPHVLAGVSMAVHNTLNAMKRRERLLRLAAPDTDAGIFEGEADTVDFVPRTKKEPAAAPSSPPAPKPDDVALNEALMGAGKTRAV